MQYVPFASDIEILFYASLASHKINHDKLDSSARKLLGLYEIRPADASNHSCRMQIHGNALTSDDVPVGAYRAEGYIKNFNTIEEYRNADRTAAIQQAGRTIWDAINDETIYSCPSLLASFIVLSFADLKKYRFSYWFAFPTLVSEPNWTAAEGYAVTSEDGKSTLKPRKLDSIESTALVDKVQTWRYAVDARQHGFFLAKKNRHWQPEPVRDSDSEDDYPQPRASPGADKYRPQTPKTPVDQLGYVWQINALSSYESGFFDGEDEDDCYVCMADPSNYPTAPAGILKNLLALVRQRWKRNHIQILCYRETQSRRDAARSIIFKMECSSSSHPDITSQPQSHSQTQSRSSPTGTPMPKVVGWERNAQGKLTGRLTDLKEYMDPKRLADQSVDLNLKLMKWRISPNLNLDIIKETKCLLLGAGTLGSYVSRNLLGWGVRKITFVDNANVSFSNPVRQPLFAYKDCLDGGVKKATRAAEALKEIYPGVESEGHVMNVPMAGHPVTDSAKTQAEFEKLQALMKEHDVVFLLMDTRESRWLPTVMGKAMGKIVMNAALGFDTFVVMRHGVKMSEAPRAGGKETKAAKELGCYFCNDVVAPVDSVKDQTLDQQCTVTRPGIAAIASALLVEVMISILQHPLGAFAPAPATPTEDRGDHPLGLVPHQIRGFLSNFQNLSITGSSYDCCSACSDRVVKAYRSHGWSFVEKALNDKDYVEELSGLKEVHRQAEAAAADIDWSDEDEPPADDDDEGELV